MNSNHEKSPTFIALDIKSISNSSDKESSTNSSPKFTKSFTRKGSQRTGGAAAAEVALAIESAHQQQDAVNNVHVNVEDRSSNLLLGTSTPTASGRLCRRPATKRLLSRWLDPRRVLFLFATLSSMGTLVLLYFTLSMGKLSIGNGET